MSAAPRAAVLFGASQAVREAIGAPVLRPDLGRYRKAVAKVRLALGEAPFTVAQQRGRAMPEGAAVTLARGDPPTTSPCPFSDVTENP